MKMKKEFDLECITVSQMNLISNSRIIWRRLNIWMRAYVVSRYKGIGTEEEIFVRLYQETQKFGDSLNIIFGRDKAEEYSNLLSQFMTTYRDLIDAHINRNMRGATENIDLLYQNVRGQAAYLAKMNPYFQESQWTNMLETFLRYSIMRINSFVTDSFAEDIVRYKELTSLTDLIGFVFAQGVYDYLTSGTKSTNPDQEFCLTYEQANTIYQIRMLWFELNSWVRSYMLSRYRGIGDETQIYNRLKELPTEYANNLRRFFGENPSIEQLELLINEYVELIDQFITAQIQGTTDEQNRITKLLYQNADQRAAAVSSLNPFWEESEWRNRLYKNLRSTLESSVTFLTGDYDRNLSIYSRLIDYAESASDYFAEGLLSYLNLISQ